MTTEVDANPPAPGPTRYHMVSTPDVDLEGLTGTGQPLWWAVTRFGSGAPRIDSVGHYEDEYVLEAGGWRFRRREAFVDVPTWLMSDHARCLSARKPVRGSPENFQPQESRADEWAPSAPG
jgi:hypothetical protein